METSNAPINPLPPPLSHLKREVERSRFQLLVDDKRLRIAAMTIVVVTLTVSTLGYLVAQKVNYSALPTNPTLADSDQLQQSLESGVALAPFEAMTLEQAKTTAETALSEFVELEILFNENFLPTEKSKKSFEEATSLATQGDAAFIETDYIQASKYYAEAGAIVRGLISTTEREIAEITTELRKSIDNLNESQARELSASLDARIQENQTTLALKKRIASLPVIVSKMREARNFELEEEYGKALSLYAEIKDLDPATVSLQGRIDSAQAGSNRVMVNSLLSTGFTALSERNFGVSRNSFTSALKLDPKNLAAIGGLQQVQKLDDVRWIRAKLSKAEELIGLEQWRSATTVYDEILNRDRNILSATEGKRRAQQLEYVFKVLTEVNKTPNKLSDSRLFTDAERVLQTATKLDSIGDKLGASIAEAEKNLDDYRYPITITLVSNNLMDVSVSNVGRLGSFDEINLELRPGQYTVRASQDGCKDIYQTVEFRPGRDSLLLECTPLLL